MSIPTEAAAVEGYVGFPEGIMEAMTGQRLPGMDWIHQQAQQAPPTARTIGEMTGAAISPTNLLGGPLVRGAARFGRAAQLGGAAGLGALSSLFSPQNDPKNFSRGAPTRLAIGAGLGTFFDLLGGPIAEDAQLLAQNNIRPPPAAYAGSGLSRTVMELPGIGETARHGTAITLADYNRRILNWTLEGLRGVSRAPVQPGAAGLNYAHNAITTQLDQAIHNLTLDMNNPRVRNAFFADFIRNVTPIAQNMEPRYRAMAWDISSRYLNDAIMGGGGRLDGDRLAKVISDFSRFARERMQGNYSQDDVLLAKVYRTIQGLVTQHSTGPAWAARQRDAALTSFAKYMVAENAAGMSGAGGNSMIMPTNFLRAQMEAYGQGRFLRDAIPFADAQNMKDVSEAVNNVLGPHRTGLNQMTRWALLAEAIDRMRGGRDVVDWRWLLPTLGASYGAHTAPAMSAARAAATSPARQTLPPFLIDPASETAGRDQQ